MSIFCFLIDIILFFIRTLQQVKEELRKHFYFKNTKVIFGIDFSASNEWQGRKTFSGQLLHKTNATKIFNPYQQVK